MISAFLFDFGGHFDADGLHWLDRFYSIYSDIGLPEIPKNLIKEAFYWADAQAELDPGMRTAEFRLNERNMCTGSSRNSDRKPSLEARAVRSFL